MVSVFHQGRGRGAEAAAEDAEEQRVSDGKKKSNQPNCPVRLFTPSQIKRRKKCSGVALLRAANSDHVGGEPADVVGFRVWPGPKKWAPLRLDGRMAASLTHFSQSSSRQSPAGRPRDVKCLVGRIPRREMHPSVWPDSSDCTWNARWHCNSFAPCDFRLDRRAALGSALCDQILKVLLLLVGGKVAENITL